MIILVFLCLLSNSNSFRNGAWLKRGNTRFFSSVKDDLISNIPNSGIVNYLGVSKDEDDVPNSTQEILRYKPPSSFEKKLTTLGLLKQLPFQRMNEKIVIKAIISGSFPLDAPQIHPLAYFDDSLSYDVRTLIDLFNLFNYAAYDPRVQGIYVELGSLSCGYGKLQEIIRAMKFFSQSQKFIIGYGSHVSEKEYLLSRSFNEFYLCPEATVDLRGISSTATFYKGVFDKVGVEPQVQRIGKYKSFGDAYNRSDMSNEQREVTSSLLSEAGKYWIRSIAHSLNVSMESIQSLWSEEGVKTPQDLKKKGMITGVVYEDQLLQSLSDRLLPAEENTNGTSSSFQVEGKKKNLLRQLPQAWFQLKSFMTSIFSSTTDTSFEELQRSSTTNSTTTSLRVLPDKNTLDWNITDFNLLTEFEAFPRRQYATQAIELVSPNTTTNMTINMSTNNQAAVEETAVTLAAPTNNNNNDSLALMLVKELLSDVKDVLGISHIHLPMMIHPEKLRAIAHALDTTLGLLMNQNITLISSIAESMLNTPRAPINTVRTTNETTSHNNSSLSTTAAAETVAEVTTNNNNNNNRQIKFTPLQRYLALMRNGANILVGLPYREVSSGPRIGIINVQGGINTGMSNTNTVGSDTLIPLIRKAKLNEEIKAVILRVDSPGGSAFASDILWRELRELSKQKPVVASMIDVAASGGYYLSMACDQIVAEELSITGSIGLVAMKYNIQELAKKLGLNTETLSIGRYAEFYNIYRNFTTDEQRYFEESARKGYDTFVTKAAQSRSMSKESMEEIAQGRVWTGRQAQERGLVDHLGGLWKAVDVAVALLPPEERKPFAKAYRIDQVEEDTIFGIPKRALLPSMTTFSSTGEKTSSSSSITSSMMMKSMEPMAICSDEGFYSGLIGTSAEYVQSEMGKALLSFGFSPQWILSMEGTGMFQSIERLVGKVMLQSIATTRK